MKKYLSAPFALVGAAALVVSSLLVTATPAQAVVDGTLVVNVVDQYGRPMAGLVQVYDTTGTEFLEGGGPPPYATTHSFSVPPGGYAMLSLGAWSGFDCEGLTPCSVFSSPVTFAAVETVSSGATTVHTMHVTVASITGANTVGSPLTVQVPPQLTEMQNAFSSLLLFPGGTMGQQWVRGTTDIPGATGVSYTTVPADGLQAMTARLTPSPGIALLFGSIGATAPPMTTNAITMARYSPAKSKTKLTVAKSVRANEPASMKVKVTAKTGEPDGFVVISIGKFRTRKALKNGTAFVTLPQLAIGTHTISTTYGGSLYFAKSKAKATVTVHS